jgi:L-asparaginase II
MKKESFIDYASASELEWARVRRQRKMIAAIMAHPSFTSEEVDCQTTKKCRSC